MTTKIKQEVVMVSGGKRKGAGRKKGESTKQVRIPVRGADAARGIVDYFLQAAQEKLEETRWWKSGGDNANVTLRLVGVEMREYSSLIGGSGERPVLVAVATDSEIGEEEEVLIEI